MALKERYFKLTIRYDNLNLLNFSYLYSFNFRTNKSNTSYDDFLKTMDKVSNEVYVVRTPLYKRGKK